MGIFSYITYEGDLPDDAKFEGSTFQSKSIFAIGNILISKKGRLMADEIDTNYHGIINFNKSDLTGEWREYWAKFTNGQLDCILLENPMSIPVTEIR